MAFVKGLKAAALLLALLGQPASPAYAAAPDKEYQVKAVFLFNFTQFVEWPKSEFPGPDAPLVVGILGPDPFSFYLDAVVRGEKALNHPIVVKRFEKLEDVKDCHVLFVGMRDLKTEAVAKALKERRILTVGDSRDFSERGGMIGFVTREGKIRLQVNLKAVQAADLEVSSKLLRLAEIVAPGEE